MGTGRVRAPHAAQVTIERQAHRFRRRARHGQADAQDRIGAKLALIRGAVQVQHRLVHGDLIQRVHAEQLFGDLFVDVLDSFEHPLAAEAAFVVVAQLQRLVHAGGRARGHRGAAVRAVFQPHFHLDGRVAARIENLAGHDFGDFSRHLFASTRVRIKNSLYRDETILVEAISLATFWMLDPGEPHPLFT